MDYEIEMRGKLAEIVEIYGLHDAEVVKFFRERGEEKGSINLYNLSLDVYAHGVSFSINDEEVIPYGKYYIWYSGEDVRLELVDLLALINKI